MLMGSDIPKLLELESNLDLYLSTKEKDVIVSEDQFLSYMEKSIEYFQMMEDKKIDP